MPFVICRCGHRQGFRGRVRDWRCPRCGHTGAPRPPGRAFGGRGGDRPSRGDNHDRQSLDRAVERLEAQVGRLAAAATPAVPALRRAWRRLEALQPALRRGGEDDPLRRRTRQLAWQLDRLDPNRNRAEDRPRARAGSRRPQDTDLHRWISQRQQQSEHAGEPN